MTGVSAFWRLTRFNLRHLLLSPVLLVLVPLGLLGLAYMVHEPAMPTWFDLIDQARFQALGLALVMFAVTTFPAIREVRHSEGFALPLSSCARLLSLALASVAVTTACAGALIAFRVLDASGPIAGTASPYAVFAVVVLSWCGPLAAVASATLTRSYAPLVGALLLVPGYLLYTVVAMGTRADEVLRRLGGVARWVLNPLPVNQPAVTELALLHLLQACLLTALLLSLCFARRTGTCMSGTRTFRPAPLGAVGVVLAGLLSFVVHTQNTYEYDSQFTDDQLYGAETEPCRVREGVTYCPLPGYDSWVDYWHAALGPPMAQVPDRARDRIPVLWHGNVNFRHNFHSLEAASLLFPNENNSFPPPGTVILFDFWDPDLPFLREDLAVEATSSVLGLPRYYEGPCEGAGQARIVLGAWMASVDEELTKAERVETAENFLSWYNPSARDLRMAHTLIDLPPESVAPVVEEHWEALLAPDTTTEEFAELLDLRLPDEETPSRPAWQGDHGRWGEYTSPVVPDWFGPTCA